MASSSLWAPKDSCVGTWVSIFALLFGRRADPYANISTSRVSFKKNIQGRDLILKFKPFFFFLLWVKVQIFICSVLLPVCFALMFNYTRQRRLKEAEQVLALQLGFMLVPHQSLGPFPSALLHPHLSSIHSNPSFLSHFLSPCILPCHS